jgi:hypothetical protein
MLNVMLCFLAATQVFGVLVLFGALKAASRADRALGDAGETG